MLFLIILIFINSNFLNALDESSENRYINQLPQKEKKELLERVARRIVQEVKSNEAIAGFESGEVPEEELKIHSEYVSQLLKEERENLKRRFPENDDSDFLKANSSVESTSTVNYDGENVKKIVNLEKTTEQVQTTEKVQTTVKEVSQIDTANDKIKDSLLRNTDENFDKSQETEKAQDNNNKQEIERVNGPENDKIDDNDKSKLIDLTLRSGVTRDDVKVDEDKVLSLLLNEKQDNITSTEPNLSNTTDTSKTNLLVDDKLNEKETGPVSIEITFVNDQDEELKKDINKTISSNITNEIPVKVIYDEKTQENKSNLEKPKTIQNVSSNISVVSKIPEIKEDEKIRYRKSFSDAVDDNLPEINQTLDNQIARKKRKSISDIQGVEINEESLNNHTKTSELIDNKKNENVTETNRDKNDTVIKINSNSEQTSEVTIAINNTTSEITTEKTETDREKKDTVIQINSNSELMSEGTVVSNITTSEMTTEKTPTSSHINLSFSVIANDTKVSLTGEVESITKTEIHEIRTEKPDVQHTQIDNFDVDENETTSVLITDANYTGSTTEEIVKMRTQHISGYPEDSNENLTTTIGTNSKNEYPRSYLEQTTENISKTNESLPNLRTQFDMNDSRSILSVNLNIQEDPKNISSIVNSSSPDPVKGNKEDDSYLNKESNVTNSAKQSVKNKTHNPSISKDPTIEIITSTTIIPLTTFKINTKKELYYAVESPVEIQYDSVVKVDNQNLSKPKDIHSVKDVTKSPLRLGIRPEDDFKDYNNIGILKFKPARNPYVVYEILPGQNPFIKKGSTPQEKPQERKPSSHPKLTFYQVSKQEKPKKLHTEQPSQIEQPNYAPVYNYAPEYAYYNPRNIYGANADDKNVKIIDERSNESDEEDLDKLFDYGMPKSIENIAHADSYVISNKNKSNKKKSKLKRVSEDYYYGFNGPEVDIRGHQYVEKLGSRKRSKKSKRWRPEKEVRKQSLKVPPNSDEYEHPRNAMFKKRPPITHNRQIGAILANLGYFGYNHNHLYVSRDKSKNPFKLSSNTSSESWIGPHLNRNESKKRLFLRSGGDHSFKNVKNTLAKLLTFRISERLKKELKQQLELKNKTFNYNSKTFAHNSQKHNSKRTKERKKHLFLLTGSPKSLYDNDRQKRPMLILTGRLKGDDWKDYYNGKTKQTGKFFKNNYVLGQESSESNYKLNTKNRNAYLNGYEDYEDLEGKIARGGNDDYKYSDPGDVSSGENDTLATLNMDVVKLILNMSKKNPNIQSGLIDSLKKQRLLYRAPKKPTVKEYDHILKEHDSNLIYFLRSDKELEAYITVIKDMINIDKNYALENYDWLGSTVDIRSATKKLAMLSGVINENPNRLHPKDLQLIKYILYLYSTTKNLLEPEKEDDEDLMYAERYSDENPKNKRFAYEEKESIDLPKNEKFSQYREYIPIQKSVHFARRTFKPITKRPWLNKDGLKERMDELIRFVEDLEDFLNDLHDAIKYISYIMKYDFPTWFKNLKDLYLSKPSRKVALEVLLHLETARLIQLIEKSAINGLDANYVKYSMNNPEEIERTKEEFALVIKLYLELKKLQ